MQKKRKLSQGAYIPVVSAAYLDFVILLKDGFSVGKQVFHKGGSSLIRVKVRAGGAVLPPSGRGGFYQPG